MQSSITLFFVRHALHQSYHDVINCIVVVHAGFQPLQILQYLQLSKLWWRHGQLLGKYTLTQGLQVIIGIKSSQRASMQHTQQSQERMLTKRFRRCCPNLGIPSHVWCQLGVKSAQHLCQQSVMQCLCHHANCPASSSAYLLTLV